MTRSSAQSANEQMNVGAQHRAGGRAPAFDGRSPPRQKYIADVFGAANAAVKDF